MNLTKNQKGHFFPQRVNILGVGVSAITMQQALDFIAEWIQKREPHYVCLTPAHAIMDCFDHKELRRVYNQSGLTTPDGMAIVWLLHSYGFSFVERVYGPDLLLSVCGLSVQKGYRHYFYGGAPAVAEKMVENLQKRYPGLLVAGIESPPFRALNDEEEKQLVTRIQSAAPDVFWVGLGSPRQETWMAEHLEKLGVPVMAGVGAAFDFLSGNKPQAPRWIQRSGMEWLFRFLSEPTRLWKRYLINYPRFVGLILLQKLKLINIPLEF